MAKKRTRAGKPSEGSATKDEVRSILKSMPPERYDEDLLDALEAILDMTEDAGHELAWLAAYDLDPTVSENAMLTLFVGLGNDGPPEPVQEELRDSAVPVLRKALQSPGVPDERKYRAGTLLDACGEDPLLEPGFAELANNPEARVRGIQEVIRRIPDAPFGMDGLFEALGIGKADSERPEPTAFFLVTALSEGFQNDNPTAAAVLMGMLAAFAAEHEMTDAGIEAVEHLAARPSEEGLWVLEELGRWPGMGAISERARKAAAELSAQGLRARYAFPRTFSHGLISCVDGVGSRSVHLLFRTPLGSMDALSIMGNDVVGIRDVWCAYDEGNEVELQVRGLAEMEPITIAPCSMALAREFVADVWALHEASGKPFPVRFFPLRRYLGEEPISPKRRVPDLSAYGLDRLEVSPSLFVGDAEDLLGTGSPPDLLFASDKAYAFVAEHTPARARKLPKAKQLAFAREVAVEERDVLLRRLAVNLENEVLAGLAHHEVNRRLARTWLGMKENVLPFHEIPYVRALCAASTEAVLRNIRAGFRNQAEVNEAALDGGPDVWDEDDTPF